MACFVFGVLTTFVTALAGQVALESDPEISKMLQAAIDEHSYPGFVAAIAKADQPIRIGAAGIRKIGDETPITIHDQLHLGSNTKAITATMIARLIERGDLALGHHR